MSTPAAESGIVVGLGSIGRRHARLLREAGLPVVEVSGRPGVGDYGTVAEAVEAHPAAYLVIASETSRHLNDLKAARAAGHVGLVLIEKPLFARSSEAVIDGGTSRIHVGYNLRFAPSVLALRAALVRIGGRILSVRMHCGQHLSSWRPGTDVSASYSAHRSRGGGVLRDLSHELDMLVRLAGPPAGFCALGGRLADVTVDSDDCWSLAIQTTTGAHALLSLNYFDEPATRYIQVNTTAGTVQCDLIRNVLWANGERIEIPADRDDSYRLMWASLLGIGASELAGSACTYEEGLAIVAWIDSIERHSDIPQWVRY